jgi:hypothetical protein
MVRQQLIESSARQRGRSHLATEGSNGSPLAGKLFDETGDRLTPTHANRKGRRYRYYVSNRMIVGEAKTKTTSSNSGGWRLQAKALEDQIMQATLAHLRYQLPIDLLTNPTADTISSLSRRLEGPGSPAGSNGSKTMLSGVDRVCVEPGRINIVLHQAAMAACFHLKTEELNSEALSVSASFQFRKRGVETKLIIGAGSAAEIDDTLIRNIAKAHQYYDAVKQGKTFDEIADADGLTKRRILQVIELAFIAPDITRSIIHGKQPIGITSN